MLSQLHRICHLYMIFFAAQADVLFSGFKAILLSSYHLCRASFFTHVKAII